MPIRIGSLVLDEDKYAPSVNIAYEYYTTDAGEIIGGNIIATITGIVSVPDEDTSIKTGSIVMLRLSQIRNLGKKPHCFVVSGIPNFDPLNSKAKISRVDIEQGPDPAWVNQGAYTIELRGIVNTIPTNSFDIVASDCVVELNRNETITIGEDSHDYVFDATYGATKAFIRFSNSINIKCETLCGSTNKAVEVLRRLVRYGPTNRVFIENGYNTYNRYLQSRSLDIDTDGSVSFSCDLILVPLNITTPALVDLVFSYNRTYESEDITYVTSGTVTGLAAINWGDLVNLTDTCSASKLANAMGVFGVLRTKYEDLRNCAPYALELQQQPNCPPDNLFDCRYENEENKESGPIKPSSGTISISRTDGVINFNFEWSTRIINGICVVDGIKTETTIEIIEPQTQYVEHILPGQGTLIQNLICKSARRRNITVSTSYAEDNCGNRKKCVTNDGLLVARNMYPIVNPLLIEATTTETKNSYTVRESYIECLP